MNYRKELKDLERNEELRIQKEKEENAQKERNKLLKEQERERKELEAKIENIRNNMKIKREKELELLQGAVKLHINDIERMQSLLGRLGIKKGETMDELRRTKANSTKTMKHLNAFKRAGQQDTKKSGPGGHSTTIIDRNNPLLMSNFKFTVSQNTSLGDTLSNNPAYRNIILPLKKLAASDVITRFDLKSGRNMQLKPVNVDDDGVNVGLKNKINTLLDQRKKKDDVFPSLTALYDENLNLVTGDDSAGSGEFEEEMQELPMRRY